jgi:hypothetical protein
VNNELGRGSLGSECSEEAVYLIPCSDGSQILWRGHAFIVGASNRVQFLIHRRIWQCIKRFIAHLQIKSVKLKVSCWWAGKQLQKLGCIALARRLVRYGIAWILYIGESMSKRLRNFGVVVCAFVVNSP